MQCTCIALTYLCLSKDDRNIKATTQEIDSIVHDGSQVYNKHISTNFANKPRYLMADELPNAVTIRGINYTIKQHNLFTGLLSTQESVSDSLTFSLDQALAKSFELSPACLLTIGKGQTGYTTAFMRHSDTLFTCFDSHARNVEGIRCPNGKAVVMQATCTIDFVSYVRKLARSIFDSAYIPFEVVTVDIDVISDTNPSNSKTVPTSMSTAGAAGPPPATSVSSDGYEPSVFCPVNSTGRRLVRCSVCFKFPLVARMFSNKKNQVPALCTEHGTVPRKEVLEAHIASQMHKECVKAEMAKKLDEDEACKVNPVKRMFSARQMQVSGKMARCFYTVYNDAKRGTLSAWSWPSREVAHMLGCNAEHSLSSVGGLGESVEVSNASLQYLVPQTHADLLDCIVTANKDTLKQKVLNALAISIRADGSVDRTQIDNVHVMAKIVTTDGLCENVFLGFAEPKCRGAVGYCEALMDAASFTVRWDELFPNVSSIVTDGASINVGERSGMWTQLQELRNKSIHKTVPLLKIWCTVHRSSLAWKDACSNVSELQTLLLDLTGLASYFRQSGIRTRELHEVANANGFPVFSMPKYFEVRWTEFTHALCHAVIGSWRAIVSYLKTSEDKDAKGFFAKWTEYCRIQLLCLVTDVTFLYGSFQKTLQSDNILLSEITYEVSDVIDKLQRMKNAPLLGGWEEQFKAAVTITTTPSEQPGVEQVQTAHAYDIELKLQSRRAKKHNKFVSDRREFDAVRTEILNSLTNFLRDRLEMPEVSAIKVLERISCETTDDELRQCHALICPDKQLHLFADAYRSAASIFKRLSNVNENDLVNSSSRTTSMHHSLQRLLKIKGNRFDTLKVSLARAIACKPHSADVERLISFYNLLKTSDRYGVYKELIYYYIIHVVAV